MAKEIIMNNINEGDDDVVVLDKANTVDDGVVDESGEDNALPKRAKLNADGTITLTLFKPVSVKVRDHNGIERVDTFEDLTFHRLNGADMRVIGTAKGDMANIVTFSRSTKINQAVMNKLFDLIDASDIFAGGDILNFFTKGGQ